MMSIKIALHKGAFMNRAGGASPGEFFLVDFEYF